jgi:hypothetical protein
MCSIGLTLFLAFTLPFTWADDFYEAAQTPDPSDDFGVLAADVYVARETRPEIPPPLAVAPVGDAVPGDRPDLPDGLRGTVAELSPSGHPSHHGPSLLYALMSLQC